MTNKKGIKRSLLMSALALLLCVSMLIGSTFAWFTDSVTSAGNIIKSGTLDVEMSYADGKENPATVAWTDASTGTIFNNDKWEPGYTEVRHIKIENNGTLALKYQLTIAPDGEVSELTDVIDVYYLDPAAAIADRAELDENKKLGTLTEVLADMATTASGNLLPEGEHVVTIALKMREDAGNEYQNKSIGSAFSVILIATQLNHEKDSFDENYDDIEVPDMDIQTINGVTYGATAAGDYVMIGVDDYTLTNFAVNDKVTVLGTGNGVNDNDRVFGKNAPLTSLTLPEGLVEIKDNALNALPNLTSVNLPSTLKTVGIQSFRQTGMSELTVPKSVETVKQGAFRDMANLTTVTVEGNVSFEDYAFRSCPKLTSIYLLGDDVTFSGSQFATHSDNGDATGITIYVKNTTVAARVYAAQTSAYGYEVKVLGAEANGSDAVSVTQVKNATDLDTALAKGENVVLSGNMNFNSSETTANSGYGATGVSVKGSVLDGNGYSLGINNWGTWDSAVHTTGGTIKNLTINSGMRGIFMGSATADVYIDNVIINGTVYTFNSDGGSKDYGVYISNSTLNGWTSHSDVHKEVVYTNCNFGKGNGYAYCRPYGPTTFKNCAFEAGFVVEALGQVTFEDCTIGGVALTADNLATLVVTSNTANATVK